MNEPEQRPWGEGQLRHPGDPPAAQHHGWLARHKEKKAGEQTLHAAQARLEYLHELRGHVTWIEGWPASAVETQTILRKGEHAVTNIAAGLMELKRAPGHYSGSSSGFSVPVGHTGVRYRVGSFRGQYVQGAEAETAIDRGLVTMTDQRIIFTGSRLVREWSFDKLVAIQPVKAKEGLCWIELPVTNRQKVSGIGVPAGQLDAVASTVQVALRLSRGEQPAIVDEWQKEVARVEAEVKNDPTPGGQET